MTDDRMALLELVEKQADGDLVREMLAYAAGRIDLSQDSGPPVSRVCCPFLCHHSAA